LKENKNQAFGKRYPLLEKITHRGDHVFAISTSLGTRQQASFQCICPKRQMENNIDSRLIS